MGSGQSQTEQPEQSESSKDDLRLPDSANLIPQGILSEDLIPLFSPPKNSIAVRRLGHLSNPLVDCIAQELMRQYKAGAMSVTFVVMNKMDVATQNAWIEAIVPFINVLIRRETNGKLFGVGSFEITQGKLWLQLTELRWNYIGTQQLGELAEQEMLNDVVVQAVLQKISNPQQNSVFIEFTHDPIACSVGQIDLLLKSPAPILSELESKVGGQWTAIRKMHQQSLFSFSFWFFRVDRLEQYWSQGYSPDPLILDQCENALESMGKRGFLLGRLLLSAQEQNILLQIVASRLGECYTLPANCAFTEAQLSTISKLASLEFTCLRDQQIVPVSLARGTVQSVKTVSARQDWEQQISGFLEYAAGLCEGYSAEIINLYKTGIKSIPRAISEKHAQLNVILQQPRLPPPVVRARRALQVQSFATSIQVVQEGGQETITQDQQSLLFDELQK